MPKVLPLTEDEKFKAYVIKAQEEVIAQCAIKGVSRTSIARKVGVQQPAISKQLNNRTMSLETFLAAKVLTGEITL